MERNLNPAESFTRPYKHTAPLGQGKSRFPFLQYRLADAREIAGLELAQPATCNHRTFGLQESRALWRKTTDSITRAPLERHQSATSNQLATCNLQPATFIGGNMSSR